MDLRVDQSAPNSWLNAPGPGALPVVADPEQDFHARNALIAEKLYQAGDIL
jgi:hypothetical protein